MNPEWSLEGNLMSAEAELLDAVLERRGRGFASDYEAWSELREKLEAMKNCVKDVQALHDELWSAVKERNDDAFMALLAELERASLKNAAGWMRCAATAKLAIERTGED